MYQVSRKQNIKYKRVECLSRKMTGYSLIEMLVVIGIFGLLAVMVTQILVSSLRASKKARRLTE